MTLVSPSFSHISLFVSDTAVFSFLRGLGKMKSRHCFFIRHFCAGTDVKEAEVICVSSGTKCINGEYMSDRGLALNDCHAEIVARRSLIRYLYSQLEHFLR